MEPRNVSLNASEKVKHRKMVQTCFAWWHKSKTESVCEMVAKPESYNLTDAGTLSFHLRVSLRNGTDSSLRGGCAVVRDFPLIVPYFSPKIHAECEPHVLSKTVRFVLNLFSRCNVFFFHHFVVVGSRRFVAYPFAFGDFCCAAQKASE